MIVREQHGPNALVEVRGDVHDHHHRQLVKNKENQLVNIFHYDHYATKKMLDDKKNSFLHGTIKLIVGEA